MIRRSTLIVVEVVLGLIAALAIGLGVAWWRLSQGPVELGFIREHVQSELSAARSGRPVGIERVELAWSPATDDLTPAQALTYELKLYRGGTAASTAARNPEPGGLSAAGEWTLADLPDGSYRWTLTAVDSAYNSGPDAEATFWIGEPPVLIFADGFESGGTSNWSSVVP